MKTQCAIDGREMAAIEQIAARAQHAFDWTIGQRIDFIFVLRALQANDYKMRLADFRRAETTVFNNEVTLINRNFLPASGRLRAGFKPRFLQEAN